MGPPKPFQPEMPATLVTLEAMNVPLNPPQKWGFLRLKKTLSSNGFGPIEHLSVPSFTNLDFEHVP